MKKHPPIYYTIRTTVRTIVWGGLALGTFALTIEALDDDRPSCDITITSPTTWEANNTPIDVTQCVHPANTILNQDGTWDWAEW